MFGSLAVGLAFLRAIDAAESDAFRVLVLQDFDAVAVEDGDDQPTEICSTLFWKKQDYGCYEEDGKY